MSNPTTSDTPMVPTEATARGLDLKRRVEAGECVCARLGYPLGRHHDGCPDWDPTEATPEQAIALALHRREHPECVGNPTKPQQATATDLVKAIFDAGYAVVRRPELDRPDIGNRKTHDAGNREHKEAGN